MSRHRPLVAAAALAMLSGPSAPRPAWGFAATPSSSSSSSSSWSPADDWGRLSSAERTVDTAALFGADLTGEAARQMEAEADAVAAGLAAAAAAAGTSPPPEADAVSPEDALVSDAIETIQNSMVLDPSDPPLYDTASSFDAYQASDDAAERAATEIGMLVRCNESPAELLVSEGRAVPDLTDEERYDWRQMVRWAEAEQRYETTNFFDLAVLQMFHEHAAAIEEGGGDDGDEAVLAMDAAGVASWLTQSLGDEIRGNPVGRHSKEVNAVIARYGSYGTGYLTEEEFQQLYSDAVTGAVDVEEKRNQVAASQKKKALAAQGGGKMTEVTVASVWRDLRNHGIRPPAEVEWERRKAELDAENNSSSSAATEAATSSSPSSSIYDECEILEWGDDDSSPSLQRPSHEAIEMCSDGTTPRRIRDGTAVFIDEESCIGCMQCATVAPSAFVMLDNGRARAFHQSASPEIKAAVSSCPVSCMHYVGYGELKKYETARDRGGGFGGRNAHIPLHVAGIDSDQNRKSSWYHSLRHKCYTSKQCPKAGCYDCPNFGSPGQNPYFQAKHREAERSRAKDLIDSGEADVWRRAVEL